ASLRELCANVGRVEGENQLPLMDGLALGDCDFLDERGEFGARDRRRNGLYLAITRNRGAQIFALDGYVMNNRGLAPACQQNNEDHHTEPTGQGRNEPFSLTVFRHLGRRLRAQPTPRISKL